MNCVLPHTFFQKLHKIEVEIEHFHLDKDPFSGEFNHEIENILISLAPKQVFNEVFASEGLGTFHIEIHIVIKIIMTEILLYSIEQLKKLFF